MRDQLFSEKAIQKIIKRAAELQKQESNLSGDSANGLSMDELLKIGAEAGLDPAHIQTAANELTERTITSTSHQNDTHIFEERVLDTNVPVKQVWNEIRAEMRQHFNENQMFGGFKENPADNEIVYNSVSGVVTTARVTRRSNGIKIQMSQRVGLASSLTEGILYGGTVTLLVFGALFAAFKTSLIESVALFSSLMVIFSIIVYALDVAWRKKKHRQLGEMMDKIADQIPTVAIVESTLNSRSVATNDTSYIEIESEESYNSTENGRSTPLKQNLKD